jgi:hypothetical protein
MHSMQLHLTDEVVAYGYLPLLSLTITIPLYLSSVLNSPFPDYSRV